MPERKNKKVIVFSGGGTGGSVSPLLAVAEDLPALAGKNGGEIESYWLGTKDGIEKKMIGGLAIKYQGISGGKLRRYFSWKNFRDFFLIAAGFFQSLSFFRRVKPDIFLTAGSFVSVPAAWAAWLSRVPVLVHQQDVRPGLANKLMAPFARVITVTFEKSVADYGAKAVWTGNPVRRLVRDLAEEDESAKPEAKGKKPLLLVMGGGTGAAAINDLIGEIKDDLLKFCRIIHQTGQGKRTDSKELPADYQIREFIEPAELIPLLAEAGLVVSRAGMASLTELAYLRKPAIIIPMPDSHQEENAAIFSSVGAAMVLSQGRLTATKLLQAINEIMNNENRQFLFQENMEKAMKPGANEKLVEIIAKIIGYRE